WFLGLACAAILLSIATGFTWRERALLRRKTRQLHEESNATFRALLEAVPNLISLHRDGQLVYLNRAARRLFAMADDAPLVRALEDRIQAEDRGHFDAMMRDARAIDVHAEPELTELRLRAADGSWRVCDFSAVRMTLAGTQLVVASGRDVTERHRLRAKVLVTDRMASLGTLAAGIAHEINNPLSYVIGNLQIMTENLASTPGLTAELETSIADATDGAERVRKIVQGLRSFSRSEEEKRVPLDVVEVLQAAVRLTGNEVRHRARLICELGSVPRVLADDARLTQVFINLIVNAAHAIPEGRSDTNRITIRTRCDERGHALVEIVDTGCGMSADVRERIFDPFFTTKGVGEGTGLGLSICHGIITALGGQIAIESAPGRGSVARVTLPPVVDVPCVPIVAAAPAAVTPARHRVLVVDDEPMVRDMLARVLRRDHDVVTVSCGRAALDEITAGGWFDVVISDVMMPNMTGVDLLEELLRVAPTQARRLVFLSGGVFTAQTRERLEELGTLVLEKPTSPKDLRDAVTRVATEHRERGLATGVGR
ncbi:MAG: ATP-binding protein, partial [Kofleriaceae bacterium]